MRLSNPWWSSLALVAVILISSSSIHVPPTQGAVTYRDLPSNTGMWFGMGWGFFPDANIVYTKGGKMWRNGSWFQCPPENFGVGIENSVTWCGAFRLSHRAVDVGWNVTQKVGPHILGFGVSRTCWYRVTLYSSPSFHIGWPRYNCGSAP
jgi:hypothetical protein